MGLFISKERLSSGVASHMKANREIEDQEQLVRAVTESQKVLRAAQESHRKLNEGISSTSLRNLNIPDSLIPNLQNAPQFLESHVDVFVDRMI
jgi:seryl-tRNA synthetase